MEPSPPTSASIGDTAAITQSLLMAMSSELVPLEPASWLWAGKGVRRLVARTMRLPNAS